MRSQRVVKAHGFPIDEQLAIRFLQRWFNVDRRHFKDYFMEVLELTGYSRAKLINKVFETNSFTSRFKRKAFVFLITLF